MVALLDVAVLVRLAGLDLLAVRPVVPQQRFVAAGELLRIRHVIHRRGEPVGTVT